MVANDNVGIELIKQYIKKYGWEFDFSEEGVIFTDFLTQTDIRFFLIIRLADPWLRINIPDFLEVKKDQSLSGLSKNLLKLNYLSRQAFFSITDKNDIALCLDLYTGAGLMYENFETAMDTITYMAEKSFGPLMAFLSRSNEKDF